MESIGQNVGDITANDRQVFENFLGHKLLENQRVVIQVVDVGVSETGVSETGVSETDGHKFQAASSEKTTTFRERGHGQNGLSGTNLEDWAIFRTLDNKEVTELESAILERSPSRNLDI